MTAFDEILKSTPIPVALALLCVTCDVIYQNPHGTCPTCGGSNALVVNKILGVMSE